ncbi:CopD family protein [Marinicella gelatinilytica]|uniref:CopD family protein n=1 Tax=Marinicella gelatinilytica TaxID=2996017 RepID=UPI002260D2C0|nr:CopD family protein [Marinicella gelatinilytica]MCX7545288.1 CopD family protein [Marinicella gelatinilytica]
MLIIKTIHIFFVVSWFACLFYLPRLFVNHAMVEQESERLLLTGLQQRLIKMMRFTMWGTVISAILLVYSIAGKSWLLYINQTWFIAKMILVLALIVYHYYCFAIHRQFVEGVQKRSHVWFRYFNEIPALILLIVIYLVIAKPF